MIVFNFCTVGNILLDPLTRYYLNDLNNTQLTACLASSASPMSSAYIYPILNRGSYILTFGHYALNKPGLLIEISISILTCNFSKYHKIYSMI